MPFARMLDKCIGEQKYSNEIKKYTSTIGNLYTASLYLGLLSLLNNCQDDLSGRTIGMFSYGSGSECEMFSVKISSEYKDILNKSKTSIEAMIADRITVDYRTYKMLWKGWLKREKKLNWHSGKHKTSIFKVDGDIKLISIKNGARYYE
jgi:3-hydroxy-3-methylglutaryl CoA synthase